MTSQTVPVTDIAARMLQLAREVFDSDLSAAFVAESEVSNTGIDIVVILDSCDLAHERLWAHQIRQLYRDAGRPFDGQCGDIFDRTTLDGLLAFTESCRDALPGIRTSACAGCPLSAFRRGDAVFSKLAGPKMAVDDPCRVLDQLTERATIFQARSLNPSDREHPGKPSLPWGSHQAHIDRIWTRRRHSGPDWTSTPSGIGLHRWFGPVLIHHGRAFDGPPILSDIGASDTCPITDISSELYPRVAAQCLATPSQPPRPRSQPNG
ncbi:hypothetical protein ACQP2U_42810 (plasmid) [Nocardia sp. CA-084685]|uniref:hypothetical protein n=1 Tax=Nocardia sp. CA-084685 TaxID=3239970 RepID=UPI003D96DBA0